MQTTALVELLDVYPTIIQLAGLPVPSGLPGESLVPLMAGRRTAHKDAAFSQFIRNATLTHTTYKDAVVIGQAVRTDRYRLVRWIDRNAPERTLATELYDHALDPSETRNRAGEAAYQETIKQLTRLLDRNFRPEQPG
jgi:arylsulfatase A-like enzyme